MEGIINFHNFLFIILIAIGVSVGIVLFEVLYKFNDKKNPIPAKFAHASLLEIIWTIIPAIILLYIAGPSFTLLYALDENCSRSLVYKVSGSQWYWSYYFPDMLNLNSEHTGFDSNLLTYQGSRWEGFRLLEVNQKVFVPQNIHITFLITSTDVLHSWAIPSFGIKLDACPDRRAHVWTPVTSRSRMPSSAWKKKTKTNNKKKNKKQHKKKKTTRLHNTKWHT